MLYDMELRTGFFKTFRCSADLDQNGIKLHPKESNSGADILIPWDFVNEVNYLRVNDKLVEMIVNSTEKSYVFRITDLNQAIAMADQMRDEFGIKV